MQTFNTQIPESWPYVLQPKHVQAITHIGKVKLLSMLSNGEIPAKRVRGRWLITKDSFINWLKEAN